MKRKRISETIDNISQKYVDEAMVYRKQSVVTRRNIWHRWGTVVACICLLVIGAIGIYQRWENMRDLEKTQVIHLVDSTVESNAGTLTYHTDNFNEHTMVFTLVKKNDMDIYITFGGYNIIEEWTDGDGTHQEVEEYIVISPYTDYEPQPNRTVINDALVITVNGVEVNEMPTEPGTYEVSIYYGELYSRLDVVYTEVEILGFGHFMIDCDGFEKNHPLTE